MKLKLFFALSALMLSTVSFAEMPPKPDSCPAADTIKTVALNAFEEGDMPGTWIVGLKANHYQTSEMWTFAFVNIPAKTGEEALQIGNQSLASLQSQTPQLIASEFGAWACFYPNSKGYWAMAFTPVEELKGKKISSRV